MRLWGSLFGATVVLTLAGCSSGKGPLPRAAGPVVEITIDRGSVTPLNATVQARVGQPITLRVNSDTADELHVHATPEHSFQVEPKPEQEFEFTADLPGSVDVELHQLNRTVATIHVQP